MKRMYARVLVFALVVICAVGATSLADLSPQLLNSPRIYYSTASLTAGFLYQVVWAPTNNGGYATPVYGSVPSAGQQYANGHWVLTTGNATINGGWSTGVDVDGDRVYTNANFGGSILQNGFIYFMAFQDATPDLNDYYSVSDFNPAGGSSGISPALPVSAYTVVAANPNVVGGTTQRMVLTGTGFSAQYNAGAAAPLQVVPEPATMSLLVLGFLPLLTRRFRRQ